MAKLFPPIVEGTIPAFYSNGVVNITIPFSINKAVNKNNINGIAVKAKTLQSSSYLFVNTTGNFSLDGESYVTISVSSESFKVGQFYKFQIAYIDLNNEIGYYSNVITGKCTANPSISIEGLQGKIDFEHVEFGYNEDRIIIKDFNANVKPGQKVALVGPTGAGKTTMIKLLMRYYDVNSGAILVDGHNIKDFNRGELREMFGMVLQDTWLFSGSIKENIRYGRLNASDEEVIEAAKAAHVHHFIKTLPDGYNMVLNEESSNISQGQKQLLTIARAILADPKILILDEATSSVDTRTELLIQKAMDNLMEGRTSFVIAHRLSTIKDADLILVINDGDIVEQGNHEELLAKGGFYANLYNSQFADKEAV